MRTTVAPALADSVNHVDKSIRLVLTERGPQNWHVCKLSSATLCRRVGNVHYARGFAEIVCKEMLLSSARVKPMLPRTLLRTSEAGSSLSNLHSTNGRDWWPLVEDIFTAPEVAEQHRELLREVDEHEEMESISVDATLRCCLRIMGQASYRAPPATRAQAGDVCIKRM